jgi:D-alanyl-lipoteichoic acid acyltransferase DltB (MBOAT superfamily)
MLAGGAAVFAVFWFDWEGWPFLLQHTAKVLAVYLLLIPAGNVRMALSRMRGARVPDWMDNPFRARTTAEFWRRYNRPMQQFFSEDVFKPVGGRRAPVRATLVTFAVSAVIHEYLFDIAIGRLQGYQTLFFLLQGCATAATLRVRPRGWVVVPWVAVTWVFGLVTSVLFFLSVNGLLPFYSGGVPAWLAGW